MVEHAFLMIKHLTRRVPGLLAVLALGLMAAPAAATVRYVAPAGQGGGVSPCYASLQAAIDAAVAGDEIRIAAGTYTGVTTRSGAPQHALIDKTLTIRGGYAVGHWQVFNPQQNKAVLDAQGLGRVLTIQAGVGVVAPLIEGLNLTGGMDFSLEGGGAVRIPEGATATLRNNVIYRNTANAGGGISSSSAGGRTLIESNTITSNTAMVSGGGLFLKGGAYIKNNLVAGNQILGTTGALYGGGIATEDASCTITGTTILGNKLLSTDDNRPFGGGVACRRLLAAPGNFPLLSGNTIQGNSADQGGGLYLENIDEDMPPAWVSGNTIRGNEARFNGGGVFVKGAAAIVQNNTVSFNRIIDRQRLNNAGGGILFLGSFPSSTLKVTGNTITDNQAPLASDTLGGGLYVRLYGSGNSLFTRNVILRNAAMLGGGVYVEDSETTFTNLLVADNQASSSLNSFGAGFYLRNSAPTLIHATLARNRQGDGSGFYLTADSGMQCTVTLVNSILTSQTTGLALGVGCAARLKATLWGAGRWQNSTKWSGAGAVISTGEATGDPAFLNFMAGDYHLDVTSAAIDLGVASGVTTDLDRHRRPLIGAPDAGAYEWCDYGAIVDYLLGRRVFSGAALARLDVNGDGKVNIADVTKMIGLIR